MADGVAPDPLAQAFQRVGGPTSLEEPVSAREEPAQGDVADSLAGDSQTDEYDTEGPDRVSLRSLEATPISPRGDGLGPRRFLEGRRAPYGIRWYGVTSLYGHFRSFISRAIAAEQVDSRDWMRPAMPAELLGRCLQVLGGDPTAASLTEGLARPLYIDFVADTGDDRDTSCAVGKMIADRYMLDTPNSNARILPRGEMLLFGGDVAYPVATAEEIHRRLTAPWNEAFRGVRGRGATTKRVLLGVPGNHDWYDGLDGFGRLFRRSVDVPTRKDGAPQPRLLRKLARVSKRASQAQAAAQAAVGLVARRLHLDEVSSFFKLFGSIARSVSAFFTGHGKKRRRRLVLHGYSALQEASYFALPLARGLDLWGVDRQLGRMDFRQRQYFLDQRAQNPDSGIFFLSADPALAYGEENKPGMDLLKAAGVSMNEDPIFFISGDFHHYERTTVGASTHVVAGGGGAFLHGTRISPLPFGSPSVGISEATYPGAAISRRLAVGVPLKLMLGRAGYLVHLAAGLLGALALWLARSAPLWNALGTLAIAVAVTGLMFLIAGFQKAHPRRVAMVAVPFGLGIGLLPFVLSQVIPHVLPTVWGVTVASATAVIALCAMFGALLFGLFLQTVAIMGLEHQQAFTVLGHQGFKHFVRLCVHPDGLIEGFVIGKDDPLSDEPAHIVDTFSWRAQRSSQERISRPIPAP